VSLLNAALVKENGFGAATPFCTRTSLHAHVPARQRLRGSILHARDHLEGDVGIRGHLEAVGAGRAGGATGQHGLRAGVQRAHGHAACRLHHGIGVVEALAGHRVEGHAREAYRAADGGSGTAARRRRRFPVIVPAAATRGQRERGEHGKHQA